MGLFDWFSKKKNNPANSAGATNRPPIKSGPFAEVPQSFADEDKDFEAMMAAAMKKTPLQMMVYYFQHIALPETVFLNHPELIKELTNGPAIPSMTLLHIRSLSQTRLEMSGQIPFDDEEFEDNERECLGQIRMQAFHRDGLTVHIVIMPEPTISPECHFAAIVFKDSEPHVYREPSPSTRYFTLEKSTTNSRPIFCEWTRNQDHRNFGEGPEPTVEKFAEAVFKKVLSQ